MKDIRAAIALAVTILGVLALGSAAASAAPVGLSAIGATYTQNFDTLASTGTSSVVPDGWAFRETGTNANGTYAANDGTSNAGNTYSYGATGSTDRAFGGLQSGSLVPFIGAQFENDTGKTITSLDIAYFGEQWRLGTAGRADSLDFVYSLDATSLADGTWTSVGALGFSSPVQSGTLGALNGNANRVAVTGSVAGLAVSPGQGFWIGWRDVNASGADDGLAVDDFSLTPRTESDLPVVVSCGGTFSTTQGYAAQRTVSASDGDDVVTGLRLDTAPAGISLSDVVPASGRGGTATGTVNVDATAAPGSYDVLVEASNDQLPPQTGSCTLHVEVTPILSIGQVQGSVPDTADGATFPSPYAGKTVTIRGVVTEKTLEGGNGFFIQNTPDTADGDPLSSDGVFVYLGSYTTLIGGYTPVVGDEIVMSGKVSEYYNQTELGSARFVALVNHDELVMPFTASPPANQADAARYWERHEGELGALPVGSTVDSPVHYYASTGDTEFYALAPDSPVSGRSDPYARRAFRGAHPLAGAGSSPVLVTDEGIKALGLMLLDPVHTFQTLTEPAEGGVSYAFSKYSLSVDAQPQVGAGVDPYDNAPPQVFNRGSAYSIANYNLENLYDYVDDPNDGCDFAGNSGCPGVSPPFDYVPASQAAYDSRIDEIAHQIVTDLHAPDVLAVAEVEDEDLNGDGQPDPLADLDARIAAIGGPSYHAAFDRDGADARGIVSAFLYRTDRVQLLPAFAGPAVDYPTAPAPYDADVSNPKALNAALPADALPGADGTNVFSRAAELAHFRVWRTAIGLSEFRDVWVVANHFSSGPDTRVAQRRQQAAYNAAIVAALEASDPGAKVDVAGDLNVYPRPDDPFSPASDQLGPLYEQGMHNLFDTLVDLHPSSAYSYVYNGFAQTLDQQFASPALFADLKAVNVAHVNSDWTPDIGGDGNRGTSDHDPMVSRFDGTATLAGLRQLVLYYRAAGLLNDHAQKGLLDRLDRAASFLAAGQQNPYANQLHSFAQDATHGKPGEIDAAAGQALAAEAAAVLAG